MGGAFGIIEVRKGVYRILVGKPKERVHLGGRGVESKIK
jgi:hypothetical protein